MLNKEFIYQRISIYAEKEIDPNSDEQVEDLMRSKFNVRLPQRRSMNESLADAISDHEILSLILQYRTMNS